ncbi:MAG: hypothetical protein AAFR22_04990, partial [Chloroflexota bacterium]
VALVGGILHPLDDRHEVRVLDVADDEAQNIAVASPQAAGGAVWHIAEFVGSGQYPFPQMSGDGRFVV